MTAPSFYGTERIFKMMRLLSYPVVVEESGDIDKGNGGGGQEDAAGESCHGEGSCSYPC